MVDKPRLGLSAAPYMGVNTWYAFGPNIDEANVVPLVDAILATGLRTAGYRYVWLDGGWWKGQRDAQGNIVVDPTQWPHGMAWLASYIHARGLRAGIYTDAGPTDCLHGSAGSYGYYQQDVNTFASWGYDAVKVDYCGGRVIHANAAGQYTQFAQAILSATPHRTIKLNISNGLEPSLTGGWPSLADSAFGAWMFAPTIATSWRDSYDIGAPRNVRFGGVLHNLDQAAQHPQVAGPGHFNDPDYLVPTEGLSWPQAQAQFAMWSILMAPMMLSQNPATLPPWALRMLENPKAIAVSQDPTFVQGKLIASRAGVQIWVRPLSHGQKAVALLNRGSGPALATVGAARIGLPAARRLAARDILGHRTTVYGYRRSITANLAPGGVVFLRVAAVTN